MFGEEYVLRPTHKRCLWVLAISVRRKHYRNQSVNGGGSSNAGLVSINGTFALGLCLEIFL